MTSTLASGEVLMALLVITLPLIALGTLIWRQADRTRSLQASIESAAEKAAMSSEGVKRIEANVNVMRDELHRDYVRQDALVKVEDRLTTRIGELDHQIRGVPMAVVGLLNAAPPSASRRRTTA